MMKKDKAAQKAAVDEYFKHWDNKTAKDETLEDREVCSCPVPGKYTSTSFLTLSPNRRERLNTQPSQDSKHPNSLLRR